MSLIGSLEDLSLGDILQIISLSKKSGVLWIRGEDGEGSIVLVDGLVRGASLKGGPADLRGVLVGGRFLSSDEFDRACERARRDGTTVDEALAAHTELSVERIDSLRRECVEAAVMAMFAWRSGEFSFDVRSEAHPDDPPLFLPTGINAQYLAMEGSRIEDESAHIRQEWRDETGAGEDSDAADPLLGVSEFEAAAADEGEIELSGAEDPNETTLTTLVDAQPVDSAAEALALAVAERIEGEDGAEMAVVGEAVDPAEDEVESDGAYAIAQPLDAGEPVGERVRARAAPATAPAPALPNSPLVVIDPDLVALEWMKETLKEAFPRIHIFQRWDLGLGPIRQYLARANRPVVLIHTGATGDPLSGIRSGADFVARLKAQQPRLPVLWLHDSEGPAVGDPGSADGALTRPSAQQLRSPRAAAQLAKLAEALRAQLATVLARSVEQAASSRSRGGREARHSPDELRRLKEATEILADASTRGEALPLAIQFASEIFDRIAMFMVRGETVVGMAQRGLPSAGGPDDEGLRRVELSRQGCAWFRKVLGTRRPVRAGPSDGGDYTLAALLGSAAAPEAYLAPIESGGEVVSVLYADNLRTRRPLGDSRALEVVLQHVGLALERAVLERALAEAQG
jgi:hypothetical protein